MKHRGRVARVEPMLSPAGFLRVEVVARGEGGEEVRRTLSYVQVDAIMPREVLLGGAKTAPRSLVAHTIAPILARMVEGRTVLYGLESDECKLEGWAGVRFEEEAKP